MWCQCMIDITKEDLEEYIKIRRNAIKSLLKEGVVPGFIDSIEIYKMHGVLEEFFAMEDWFHE